MKSESTATLLAALTLPVVGRDHLRGPNDAPLKLIEYGDYECPYCSDADSVVKAVQEELGSRLCFAFRNFPLVNVHPHAQRAAEAAEAAGAQGRFWEMHDLLFENQDSLDDDNLVRHALALGLDPNRFIADLSGGVYAVRVREDFRNGARSGVNGTPTFFVNGSLYAGAVDVAVLVTALNHRRAR